MTFNPSALIVTAAFAGLVTLAYVAETRKWAIASVVAWFVKHLLHGAGHQRAARGSEYRDSPNAYLPLGSYRAAPEDPER